MLGSLIDGLIMFGAGAYAAFMYPKTITKRIDEGAVPEQEADRIKWMRPLGYGLMAVGLLFVIFG